MSTKPVPTPARTHRWVTAAVLALLLIMTAQIVHAVRGQSLTWDEGDHIFAGYESWKTLDFGLNPEHPPMVKQLATLPLLPLHLNVPKLQSRSFKTESYLDGRELLFRNGPANGGHYSSETLVFRVRMFAMLLTLAAALLVFFAAREMFSLRAGLIALTLFCFSPNLLAHGAYVTTDMGAACTIFATIYALWRYVTRPTLPRLAVVGIAAGIALAAKHSTVLLAPMLVLLLLGELARPWLTQHWPSHKSQHLFSHKSGRPIACPEPVEGCGLSDMGDDKSGCPRSRFWDLGFDNAPNQTAAPLPRRALHLLGVFAAILFLSVAILWAFYGFRYNARPAGLTLSPSLAEYVGPLAGIQANGILFAARHHLLPESYLYGLADVRKMANDMPSYFFGHVYLHGIWYYFPILFLIKSTLAMLILLALTVFAIACGRLRNYRALWFLIAPPALYFIVAMSSHLNIGARHILPVWVFCCVLAAAGISALIDHDSNRNRRWAWVAAALLLFHAASSLHAAPNYIAYSNEAWGGPTHTHLYLSDSNTDWGQQLIATSAYLRQHNIKQCWIAYFVTPFVLPEDYGIPCRLLPTPDSFFNDDILDVPAHIDGPILISAGDLNGFELGSSVLNPYQSLRHAHPVAFIQDGIFVFDGSFSFPLASALAHVQRSTALLKANDIPNALREATLAETIAPGEVEPELALGNALAAAGKKDEAREAYNRATTTIDTMEPDARTKWLATVQKKLATL